MTLGDCTLNHSPNTTLARYVSLQPAMRRLFATPTFWWIRFLAGSTPCGQDAEVRVGVSFTDATLIFLESYI